MIVFPAIAPTSKKFRLGIMSKSAMMQQSCAANIILHPTTYMNNKYLTILLKTMKGSQESAISGRILIVPEPVPKPLSAVKTVKNLTTVITAASSDFNQKKSLSPILEKGVFSFNGF